MKIVMIYDQIQSGKGIKDDHMVPLGLVKESCGPAIMMEPFLKQVNGHVVCCLYCGDGFYEANTTYGKIGVKVWIYKGEVLPEKKAKVEGGEN